MFYFLKQQLCILGHLKKRVLGANYFNYNSIHSVAGTCNYSSPFLLCSLHPISISHLAASPPGLRLETLGFPSLSVPPEMVKPRVLPSFLISSTIVTPLNSSERVGIKTNNSVEGQFPQSQGHPCPTGSGKVDLSN